MTSSMNCDTARDLFFELRQGRVEPDQKISFQEHLQQCSACRDYVEKLDTMLDEAMIWEPAAEPDLDRQELFASILGELQQPEPSNQSDQLNERVSQKSVVSLAARRLPKSSSLEPEEAVFDEDLHRWAELQHRRRHLRTLLISAAAVILLAIAWPLLLSDLLPEQAPATAPSSGLDRAERLAISDNLRLFPSPQARWNLSAADSGWEVDLQAGSLVIEFLPSQGEELHFQLPEATGKVVGTVFYLNGDNSEVGVLTGGVQVAPAGGEERLIRDRQAWRGGELIDVDPARWQQLQRLVDPEEHNRLLALATSESSPDLPQKDDSISPLATKPTPEARPSPDGAPIRAVSSQQASQPSPATPPKQERPGPTRLRLQAERALRDHDFQRATALYEDLLELLPPADRAAGSIRLDLARIYHRHLDDLESTAKHLRFFVQTWPDDAVTPQALAELCRLVDNPAQEPHCRRR